MKRIIIEREKKYKELGDLFGLFFEDINHAADGGLYAEMVQNGSFEFCEVDRKEYHALTAWEKSEELKWEVREGDSPFPSDERDHWKQHYLHVEIPDKAETIKNSGFKPGIYVEKGKSYDFCVYVRIGGFLENNENSAINEGKHGGRSIRITVEDADQKICGSTEISVAGEGWKRYEAVIKADETTCEGKLTFCFEEKGAYDLDLISLMPEETFPCHKELKLGIRRDIAEALKEMKPKFMRFPGGCLVHDGSLDPFDRNSMYRWKRTVGPAHQRATWRNNWGYNQSFGLGFFEYFCFCEEIGAEPLPVLPGGFNPHKGEGVPVEQIQEWVDDALDLIEFANGEGTSRWGKVRADMGHPSPFHLKYIGIGNEEIGEGFFERYPYFHKAIREKYPDIKIINTAGPFAVGEGYDAGWNSAKKYGSDYVDEHYYSSPEWFLANMHRYDDFDVRGPKVFLGEYASWGNTFYNALVEAAYMTHLEKSEAVGLACYAPMLCNVNYVNWKPDMLFFDNHRILKTANYHVQKLFMQNQGTDEVRIRTEGLSEITPLTDEAQIAGGIFIESNETEGRLWDIKVTDLISGKVKEFPETMLTADDRRLALGTTDSEHVLVEFCYRRTKGRKGLKIFFGEKDEKNRILWEFGGWDNWDCNISSLKNGRGSTISHRIFHVEDKDYVLKLEIEGRNIRTTVNGEVYNQVKDRLPEIEELYLAASTEGDDAILKAVNLTGEAKRVRISPDGEKFSAEEKSGERTVPGKRKLIVTVLRAKGELSAENTFEEPEKLRPETEEQVYEGNETEFEFAPHSLSVLRFCGEEG